MTDLITPAGAAPCDGAGCAVCERIRATKADAARIAEEKAAAARKHREVGEIYERSDTDGFLSAWASGLTAREHDRRADLMKDGGVSEFLVLVNEAGEIVSDRSFENRYGRWSWRLDDRAAEAAGRRFVPFGPRSRVCKALGLKEAKVLSFAYVKLDGRGTGLSGTAWVATFPERESGRLAPLALDHAALEEE